MEENPSMKDVFENTAFIKTVGDLKKWLEHIPDDQPIEGFLKGDFGGWQIDIPLHLQDKTANHLGSAIFYCEWNMPPALDQEFGEFVSCKNAVASGNVGDADGEDIYGKELWKWVKGHNEKTH